MEQFTMAEVATKLDVSTGTVYRYIKGGQLAATKQPGRTGQVSIERRAVDSFLSRRAAIERETFDSKTVAAMCGLTLRTVQALVEADVFQRHPDSIGDLKITRRSRITRRSVDQYMLRRPGAEAVKTPKPRRVLAGVR